MLVVCKYSMSNLPLLALRTTQQRHESPAIGNSMWAIPEPPTLDQRPVLSADDRLIRLMSWCDLNPDGSAKDPYNQPDLNDFGFGPGGERAGTQVMPGPNFNMYNLLIQSNKEISRARLDRYLAIFKEGLQKLQIQADSHGVPINHTFTDVQAQAPDKASFIALQKQQVQLQKLVGDAMGRVLSVYDIDPAMQTYLESDPTLKFTYDMLVTEAKEGKVPADRSSERFDPVAKCAKIGSEVYTLLSEYSGNLELKNKIYVDVISFFVSGKKALDTYRHYVFM